MAAGSQRLQFLDEAFFVAGLFDLLLLQIAERLGEGLIVQRVQTQEDAAGLLSEEQVVGDDPDRLGAAGIDGGGRGQADRARCAAGRRRGSARR